MNKINIFIEKITNISGFTLTDDQKHCSKLFFDFLNDNNYDKLFLLKGFAGTGKTSLIKAFIEVAKDFCFHSNLLAPTGRAAKVLSSYTLYPSSTIHREIYYFNSQSINPFKLKQNKTRNCLFFIDEASMIASNFSNESVSILDDLFEYVYNGANNYIVFIGDVAQLPPINEILSKALDANYLQLNYFKKIYSFELSDIVRQKVDSGILFHSTKIRKLLAQESIKNKVFINNKKFNDVNFINSYNLIEMIENSYSKYGLENTIILCSTNYIANIFNQNIRNKILYRDDEIGIGDYIMIVKNNYYWTEKIEDINFLANGDIAKITALGKQTILYGFRFIEAEVSLIDYNNIEPLSVILNLDSIYTKTSNFDNVTTKKLFMEIEKDYANIGNKRLRYKKVYENKYFNALQIKFSYAITTHKSQGGQWKSVFVNNMKLYNPDNLIDFLRWYYTAFTRTQDILNLINMDDDLFENTELKN